MAKRNHSTVQLPVLNSGVQDEFDRFLSLAKTEYGVIAGTVWVTFSGEHHVGFAVGNQPGFGLHQIGSRRFAKSTGVGLNFTAAFIAAGIIPAPLGAA